MIRCWTLFNKSHAATAARHPLVGLHLAHRRKRRIRRAIIIACISIGAAGAAIALPPILHSPPPSPHPPAAVRSGGALPESWREIPNSAASTPIPEPSSAALLAPAAMAALIWRLRHG